MPKVIDHQQRAVEITEAAWRVLVRSGSGAVSVRNVAQEAGVATASLRRAFPTQASLLAACLRLMGERVAARIAALPAEGGPVDQALAAVAETVPLDDERRVEMEVYLALGASALSDPALDEAFGELAAGMDELASLVVTGLAPGLGADERRRAVLHLGALLDGLALRVLHGSDATKAMAVLREHLEGIAGWSR